MRGVLDVQLVIATTKRITKKVAAQRGSDRVQLTPERRDTPKRRCIKATTITSTRWWRVVYDMHVKSRILRMHDKKWAGELDELRLVGLLLYNKNLNWWRAPDYEPRGQRKRAQSLWRLHEDPGTFLTHHYDARYCNHDRFRKKHRNTIWTFCPKSGTVHNRCIYASVDTCQEFRKVRISMMRHGILMEK